MRELQFKNLIAETLLNQDLIIDIDEQVLLLEEVVGDLREEQIKQLKEK